MVYHKRKSHQMVALTIFKYSFRFIYKHPIQVHLYKEKKRNLFLPYISIKHRQSIIKVQLLLECILQMTGLSHYIFFYNRFTLQTLCISMTISFLYGIATYAFTSTIFLYHNTYKNSTSTTNRNSSHHRHSYKRSTIEAKELKSYSIVH